MTDAEQRREAGKRDEGEIRCMEGGECPVGGAEHQRGDGWRKGGKTEFPRIPVNFFIDVGTNLMNS